LAKAAPALWTGSMLDEVVGDQLEGRLVAHHGAVKEGQNDLSRTGTGALRRLVHMLIVSELGPTDLLAYIAASGRRHSARS
jgi:hypothetical protein